MMKIFSGKNRTCRLFGMLYLTLLTNVSIAQTYTSYFTGDTSDVVTAPLSGTVLMGGATENDNAMRWFLERADGGDIVVLRASGDDGYNDYFFEDLGVTVNSVESIVCLEPASGSDPYILQQVQNAEALWFAGGDQWDYVSYWRDTPLEDVFNDLILNKKITIGGTSAGCAIQGQAYFSAENGSVTTNIALNNPYHNTMTLGYNDFLQNPFLWNTISDTHYDNPDRRGRHAAFLARLYTDYGVPFFGIGVEEYTAVCIDENGLARVYGSYPDYDDYAFFLQPNCPGPNNPETCNADDPITWNRDNAALKVIRIPGTEDGSVSLNLVDWKTLSGADTMWQNWWIEAGDIFYAENQQPIDCSVGIIPSTLEAFQVSPNPASTYIQITQPAGTAMEYAIANLEGKIIQSGIVTGQEKLNIADLPDGMYCISFTHQQIRGSGYFIKL